MIIIILIYVIIALAGMPVSLRLLIFVENYEGDVDAAVVNKV